MSKISRRRMLKGMMGGAVVSIGLPYFEHHFNSHGTALAKTGALPSRFGTWFWGCGMNPARWVPETLGKDYDLPPELAMAIEGYSHKVSVLSGFDTPVNGANNHPHYSVPIITLTGVAPPTAQDVPRATFDTEIANVIGTTTRFRSLDLTADATSHAWSAAAAGTPSPAESSPVAFYQRIFTEGFQIGGQGTFTPDPAVMARKSVLSAVIEQAKALESELGSHDRQRLDQYLTAIRQLENQVDVLLQEPPVLEACFLPEPPGGDTPGLEISDVVARHHLMADLLSVALACDQSRVFNLNLWRRFTDVYYPGEEVGYHQMTHDEVFDTGLGYQPLCQRFHVEAMGCFRYLLERLDSIEEGDGTLLDNSVVFAHSCTEFPKDHGTKNIPVLIAGTGGGRITTGKHIAGAGSPTSRAALTMQQAFDVPVATWGDRDIETSSPIAELLG